MSFLSQPLTLFSIGPKRSFGGIDGYVTISESTTDALEITQQPVQQGAMISDHAFKKPVSFSMQMLFSDNTGFFAISGITTSLAEIYESLLDLQDTLEPFDVVTPKRVYTNMMLQSLGMTTDKKTENCLAITASFQEVIIVQVTTTLVPRSKQKNPGKTGGILNAGKKSALLTLKQGIGAAFK